MRKIEVYTKGHDELLTENLRLKEVECKCTFLVCTRTIVERSTCYSFQRTRDRFGSTLQINSGHRCQVHNMGVGGARKSYHLIFALDLQPIDNMEDLDRLEAIAREEFDFVIRYENFVHCDNREIIDGN